jgi:hypothetical protein
MPIVQAAIVRAVSVLGDNLGISIQAADVRTVGLRAIGRMQPPALGRSEPERKTT